jgi:hypothetical protein
MKRIIDYIYESLTDMSVTDLSVEFNTKLEQIIFEVPVGYTESDVQMYIGDKFLITLPADNNNLLYRWGVNKDHIIDAYFEYKTYDELDKNTEHTPTYEWDSSFDTEKKETELKCIRISGLKYIIKFDKFLFKKEENQPIDEVIDKIFRSFDSSAANNYGIEIIYKAEMTTYAEKQNK